MIFLLALPFAVQGLVMFADEFYFHRKRGLGRWERIGHPLDTLTVLLCFSILVWAPVTPFFMKTYLMLSIFSCIFVTKDEFVHAKECIAAEQWLHSLLFILHPFLLLSGALFWFISDPKNELGNFILKFAGEIRPSVDFRAILFGQFSLMLAFALFQFFYWNIFLARQKV